MLGRTGPLHAPQDVEQTGRVDRRKNFAQPPADDGVPLQVVDALGAAIEIGEDKVTGLADGGKDRGAHPHVLEQLAKARVALPGAHENWSAYGEDEEGGSRDHQRRRGCGLGRGIDERRAHFFRIDGGNDAEPAPRCRLVGREHLLPADGDAGGAGCAGDGSAHEIAKRLGRIAMNLLGLTRRADGVGKGELALVEPADEQATGLVQAAVNARQPIREIFGGPGIRALFGECACLGARGLDEIAAVAVELGLVQRGKDAASRRRSC